MTLFPPVLKVSKIQSFFLIIGKLGIIYVPAYLISEPTEFADLPFLQPLSFFLLSFIFTASSRCFSDYNLTPRMSHSPTNTKTHTDTQSTRTHTYTCKHTHTHMHNDTLSHSANKNTHTHTHTNQNTITIYI